MKKLLVAALAVLLAAAAGAYVIVVRPLVAPAAQTIAAEAALATPDLVLLAALNVRQMVFLERWLLGAPVIRAVDARWVLFGDAAAHDRLVSGLTQIPPAAEAELAWWRALAHSDLVSIGMWRPREADKSVSGPLLKMSAQAVLAQTVGVEHVYLGLGAKTVPPSGRLRLVLDAADGAGIQQKVDEWRRALQQSREAWAQTAPSLAPLLDSV